jgi:glucan biosynthesis protein C
LLGTIGFGAVLFSLPFAPRTKVALNILATTMACLLAYQLLVRYTLVGVGPS